MPYTGSGVVVGIMDYAINFEHRGLLPQTAEVKRVNYAQTNKGKVCKVAFDHRNQQNEHGTHMAGIIAAKIPFQNWSGVAPDASLIGLNIYEQNNDKNLDDNLFVKLIEVAIAENVRVLNLSLVAFSGDLKGKKKAALHKLIEKGCLVCCASGNQRLEKGETLGFPANLYLSGLVVVGACQVEHKKLFYYAPHDEKICLFVPVQSMTTLGGSGDETHSFPAEDSSSVATAIVSGVAALLLEANPSLSPKQLAHILRNTGEPLPEEHNLPSCWGKRCLDAEQALKLAERYHI